ncbi:MAG: hypothetical protein KDK26_16445 [Roseivivax sp.]|nr:hypothetical protein [Roseivivax sp.]
MLGDPERHFWLTRSVARTLGLNLSEAIASHRLSEGEYAEMVTRCRGCSNTADCEEWLSCGGTKDCTAPRSCRIAEMLARLRVLH